MKEVPHLFKEDLGPRYDYFATPDGEEVFQKLWHVLKPATVVALAFSTVDVMCYSKPKGYGNILARIGYVSFPVIGCTTVFVIATNVLASLRNKQDKVNWVAGGMAAGGVMGMWTKKQPVGWLCAAAFGLAAFGKKMAIENNYTFLPEARPYYSHRSGGYDYTLTEHIPGNYTTSTK